MRRLLQSSPHTLFNALPCAVPQRLSVLHGEPMTASWLLITTQTAAAALIDGNTPARQPVGAAMTTTKRFVQFGFRPPAPKKRIVKKKKKLIVKKTATPLHDSPDSSDLPRESEHDASLPHDAPHSRRDDDDDEVQEESILEFPMSSLPPTRVMPFVYPVVATTEASHGDTLTDTHCTHVVRASADKDAPRAYQGLPPWPVDSVEFNARAPYGGHDQRIAAERQRQHVHPQHKKEAAEDTATGEHAAAMPERVGLASPPVKIPPALSLSLSEQRARLEAAQRSGGGQAALAMGGWVCAACFNATPLASRSVCSQCFTVRHDLTFRRAAAEGRRDAQNWRCPACDEFNSDLDGVCRCCHTSRANCESGQRGSHAHATRPHEAQFRRVSRHTVADELEHAVTGSVLDVRGRVLRWRCVGCFAVNSLQARVCRHCRGERFAMALRCTLCAGATRLNNAVVYGITPAEAADSSHHFHLTNRHPRHAPRLRCTQCDHSLHNATVLSPDQLSDQPHLWWCACGMTNTHARHICLRCRFPRLVPPSVLKALLARRDRDEEKTSTPPRQTLATGQTASGGGGVPGERGVDDGWDFEDCTHWYCASCDGINKASRYVVYAVRNGTDAGPHRNARSHAANGAGSESSVEGERHIARMFHGHSRCQHCHAPWHHLVLPDGLYWRCACLQINGVNPVAELSHGVAHSDVANPTAAQHHPAERQDENKQEKVSACLCCGLPALDDLRPDMLSMWTPGDWYCVPCGRHCYRERMRCLCGAARPGTAAVEGRV